MCLQKRVTGKECGACEGGERETSIPGAAGWAYINLPRRLLGAVVRHRPQLRLASLTRRWQSGSKLGSRLSRASIVGKQAPSGKVPNEPGCRAGSSVSGANLRYGVAAEHRRRRLRGRRGRSSSLSRKAWRQGRLGQEQVKRPSRTRQCFRRWKLNFILSFELVFLPASHGPIASDPPDSGERAKDAGP
jgi:hypothetical protein